MKSAGPSTPSAIAEKLSGRTLRSWLKICGFLDPIFDPGAQRPQQFGLQRRATDALASLDPRQMHL